MKTIIRFLPAILMVSLLASCGSDSKKTDESSKQQTVSEAYSWEHIFVKDDQCPGEEIYECTHVLLDFPIFKGKQMAKANKLVNHYIADIVGYGDAENPALVNLDEAANSLVQDYQKFHKEFPDSPQVWNVRLKSRFTYEKENLLCLMIVSESFTGGAHGALNKRFMTFSMRNGEPVYLLDRVGDKEGFKALAEQKFRQQKKLPPLSDYNKSGYHFPDNKFQLPANIGIDDKGYLLHYNAYEIAPYAMGPTDIRVDFDELK
jgi:hypothetical protein